MEERDLDVEVKNIQADDNNLRINETVITGKDKGSLKAKKIVYYILGVLEVLFTFRLIFKILGANPENVFAAIVYTITNLFIAPFVGIFRMVVTSGIETESVLEPPLIIAMIVYATIALGIVKLIDINSKK